MKIGSYRSPHSKTTQQSTRCTLIIDRTFQLRSSLEQGRIMLAMLLRLCKSVHRFRLNSFKALLGFFSDKNLIILIFFFYGNIGLCFWRRRAQCCAIKATLCMYRLKSAEIKKERRLDYVSSIFGYVAYVALEALLQITQTEPTQHGN